MDKDETRLRNLMKITPIETLLKFHRVNYEKKTDLIDTICRSIGKYSVQDAITQIKELNKPHKEKLPKSKQMHKEYLAKFDIGKDMQIFYNRWVDVDMCKANIYPTRVGSGVVRSIPKNDKEFLGIYITEISHTEVFSYRYQIDIGMHIKLRKYPIDGELYVIPIDEPAPPQSYNICD